MRYSISQTPNRLLIVIPRRFSLFLCLFVPFWTILWISLVVENPAGKPIPVYGIAFFAAVTVLFAYRWLWNVGGREVVEITPLELTHRQALFGISRANSYKLERITSPRFVNSRSRGLGGRTPSGIVFSYDGKRIRLGDDLTQAEAKSLVAEIIRAFPQHAERWNTYDAGMPELGESMTLDLERRSR
jgi:hypothetical protein